MNNFIKIILEDLVMDISKLDKKINPSGTMAICNKARDLNKEGKLTKYLHFDFVYSSACPCSYELAEYARKYRNKATVSHSQRSVARISIEFDKMVWIEELQEMCDRALNTETQVVVKREDEMAFAELNGSYLKFVEAAARLLYEQLIADKRIKDFRVIC